ncbi:MULTISPECIES: sensor histidine kinase [unclassified Coleofasciculus]|uniref:sensor histidine kinase n=1 Tax=unclassified Coleofasciculus TaxID=2692782 RepID=UPI00187E6406|nr:MULTISPECIES: HAMP domain-containing sensor histidine kinase [unclassified Coleofasciculus]MBE9125584.1 HAMP domain-containing histidine kinase [Coleofasciculus sp. LEGE 07081]MBE9147298.1 HAMP domain-containing histidine kinase [Coleofasciculus sp. LEGE 07092]
MFQKTRYQLSVSYLAVFAALLGIFTLAVRVVFARSLSQKLTENLTILGESAAAEGELDNGRLQVENDFPTNELIIRHQALQWFDSQCHLVDQQGQYILTLPLSFNIDVQTQKIGKIRIRGVTLPVISSDNGRLIGYVRASQSLEEFDETLAQLDWGLGSGVVMTLALSSIGGLLLTRKAMQPIEQSFQRLKQFTGDASHELRSPLMAITTNVEVALEYPEGMRSTDAKKFKAIANAADQMTRLTEDLLLLARSDQVQSPHQEAVNLEEILHNLVELYQPQADAKEINVKANLTQPLYVLGDLVQLTRVFANLIQNALQYTPTGGLVEIQTNQVDRQLYISVKDTGIGMTPEQLQHIFDRFWRADQARSYQSNGFGLGLAIAQSIVQSHGGSLTVTSQLGVGSCFTVRLPTHYPL